MHKTPSWLRGLAWTSPWWLGFLMFLAIPMGISLYISLCDYSLLQPPVFVGLGNYQALAIDPVFHKVLTNTAIYALIALPAGTALAIMLAILLNQNVRGQAIFRTCVFVPTVVPLVAVGVVWMWMLNPQFGLFNQMFRLLGAEGPMWLESPNWAMVSLVMVSMWLVGSAMVIYLAGLQGIPSSLYEAARIDGASHVRQFWHVTLPGLSPVILFNVIVGLIATWQVFALPFIIWRTRPGPDRATYFYTMYLYDNAFRYLKMGYASAMGWIQFLIILVLTGLLFWVGRKSVHYLGE